MAQRYVHESDFSFVEEALPQAQRRRGPLSRTIIVQFDSGKPTAADRAPPATGVDLQPREQRTSSPARTRPAQRRRLHAAGRLSWFHDASDFQLQTAPRVRHRSDRSGLCSTSRRRPHGGGRSLRDATPASLVRRGGAGVRPGFAVAVVDRGADGSFSAVLQWLASPPKAAAKRRPALTKAALQSNSDRAGRTS